MGRGNFQVCNMSIIHRGSSVAQLVTSENKATFYVLSVKTINLIKSICEINENGIKIYTASLFIICKRKKRKNFLRNLEYSKSHQVVYCEIRSLVKSRNLINSVKCSCLNRTLINECCIKQSPLFCLLSLKKRF